MPISSAIPPGEQAMEGILLANTPNVPRLPDDIEIATLVAEAAKHPNSQSLLLSSDESEVASRIDRGSRLDVNRADDPSSSSESLSSTSQGDAYTVYAAFHPEHQHGGGIGTIHVQIDAILELLLSTSIFDTPSTTFSNLRSQPVTNASMLHAMLELNANQLAPAWEECKRAEAVLEAHDIQPANQHQNPEHMRSGWHKKRNALQKELKVKRNYRDRLGTQRERIHVLLDSLIVQAEHPHGDAGIEPSMDPMKMSRHVISYWYHHSGNGGIPQQITVESRISDTLLIGKEGTGGHLRTQQPQSQARDLSPPVSDASSEATVTTATREEVDQAIAADETALHRENVQKGVGAHGRYVRRRWRASRGGRVSRADNNDTV